MDLKNRLFGAVVLTLSLPCGAFAGAHYGAQPCLPSELGLSVSNPTHDELEFWIQVHEASDVREVPFSLPGGKRIQLSGTQFLSEGSAFAIRDHNKDLKYTLSCHGVSVMTEDASPRVEYKVPSSPLVLHLMNLHHSRQAVSVSSFDFWGRKLATESIDLDKNYVSIERKLLPPSGTKSVVIEGGARLSAQLFNANTMAQVPGRAVPSKVFASPTKAYFLATNDARTESYVVPLEDPALIAQARDQIKNDTAKITVADIEPAPLNGDNRDLLASDAAPWSWRVKAVYGFSDIGHQDCSGTPGFIEDFKESWMPDAREICFWTFNLKRELTPDEVSSGRLRRP